MDDYLTSNPPQLAQATALCFQQLASAITQLEALPAGEREVRAAEFEGFKEDFIELGNRLNVAFFSTNQDVELDELNNTLNAYRSGAALLAKTAGLAENDRMSLALQAALFENATPMKLDSGADIDAARITIASIEGQIVDHVIKPLFGAQSVTQSAGDLSGTADNALNTVEYEGSLSPSANQDVTR